MSYGLILCVLTFNLPFDVQQRLYVLFLNVLFLFLFDRYILGSWSPITILCMCFQLFSSSRPLKAFDLI